MRRKNRILVVDDNPVNLSILEEILSGEYRLAFAQNGPDAPRALARFCPDYVLLDVMMPGVDGLEICKQIRATPGHSQAIIIMVSAKAMPSEQAAGLDAGADDYLTKPFDEVELLQILRQFDNPNQQGSDAASPGESNDELQPVL